MNTEPQTVKRNQILKYGKGMLRDHFTSSPRVKFQLIEIKKLIGTDKSASATQMKKLVDLGFRFIDETSPDCDLEFLNNYWK